MILYIKFIINKIIKIRLYYHNFSKKFICPILTHSEGQVFGIGCKIFTIAGPVILYGILASWVLGVIYWVGGVMGII